MKIFEAIFFLFGSVTASCLAQTPDVSLVHADYSNDKGVAKFDELERAANTSKIKVVQDTRSSVGSSMFIVLAFYQVARARHYEYFATLKEWMDKDGAWIYIAGFTNKKDADLKREFGEEYSHENESGQKRDLLSVSQFAPLFERTAMKPPPATPAASAIPPVHDTPVR